MKTILILGGGIGGIVAMHELKKKMGSSQPFRIILFEKEKNFTFYPSLPWLLIGKRKKEKVQKELKFGNENYIQIVYGEIQSIDTEKFIVVSNGAEYRGDFIIISLGAETKADDQLDKNGYSFFSIDSTQILNKQLKKFEGGKIVVLVSSMPYKCPAAPYETTMLIEYFIRKKGIRNKTEIALYSPEAAPLGVAGQKKLATQSSH